MPAGPRTVPTVRSPGPATPRTTDQFYGRVATSVAGPAVDPLRWLDDGQSSRNYPYLANANGRRSPKTITNKQKPANRTSRNALGLIRISGTEPEIIEYLK